MIGFLSLFLVFAFFVLGALNMKSPGFMVLAFPAMLFTWIACAELTEERHSEYIPVSEVSVARTSTTLYLEYEGETLETKSAYVYNNWPDTSRVKLYQVWQNNTFAEGDKDLKLEVYQKPGASTMPKSLSQDRD
jgi:hypothetical protein